MPTTQTLDDQDDVVQEAEPAALPAHRLHDPSVPRTLTDLAARKSEAIEILETKALLMEIARKRGIRMTGETDWVLFRNPDGMVTGYLTDAGCERARDLLGIEIFAVKPPEKILAADGQSFMYLQSASGRSRITDQVVEDVEGGRASTEDFCKDDVGAALELKVRKACRANVDGNICRELMGLRNVPLADMQEAWAGTKKDWTKCPKGKGFGTQAERYGATREGVPDVPPPTCPVCKTPDGTPLPLVYRPAKGTNRAFYGCRNWDKHKQVKAIVDADKWVAQHAAPATASASEREDNTRLDAEIAATERKNGPRDPGTRQPGEDG